MAIFMHVEGLQGSENIGGAATEGHHDRWITIDTFRLSGRKDVDDSKKTATEASERSTGVASFAKAALSKAMDSSSPALLRWAARLEERTVQIDFCRENGKPYLQFELGGARLDRYAPSQRSTSSGATDAYEEELELFYKSLTVVYTTFDAHAKVQDVASFFFEQPEEKDWLEPDAGDEASGGLPAGVSTAAMPPAAALELSAFSSEAERLRRPALDKAARQPARRLEVSVGSEEFVLASLEGEESISRPFHFELLLTSTDLSVDPKGVVGQKVRFSIVDDPDSETDEPLPDRHFHGYVAQFTAGAAIHTHEEEEKRRYTALVVPWLWFLTKNTNCRVFQDMAVPEIVEAVFADRGFTSDDYRIELHGTYAPREHCVQYRETDLDFVSRLFEEEGIFYFFEHAEDGHVLVLADGTPAYRDCPDKEVVFGSRTARARQLSEWRHSYRLVGWNALYRDYNFKTPTATLEVKEAAQSRLPRPDVPKAEEYGLFDYPGRYSEKSVGAQRAKTRIEAEEARFELLESEGSYDSFTPGGKFEVAEHEVEAEASASWVVLTVRHSAQDQSRGADALVLYKNSFRAMPSDVVFRPARRTPRPVVGGPQTAVVVGPSKDSDEEIYTDEEGFGRVKVQFHWDRINAQGDTSSLWVRVVQDLAGKEWGRLTIPRVGQEVVVEFLDGDPDHPIVTGCLYNGDYRPPYALPANKTRTVLFKSRSSEKGDPTTFNELWFDDKKDAEKIYFHAQKDFERVVEHDDALTVGQGGEGSQTVTIEKDQSVTLSKGDHTLTVAEGRQDVTVHRDQSLTLEKGSQTVTVERDQTTTLHSGDRSTTITKGSDTLSVKKDRSVSVEGKETERVKGDRTLVVEEGDVVTRAEKGKVVVEANKSVVIQVGDNTVTIDDSGITVKGKDKIQLKVGSTTAKLSSSGVQMKGSTIKLN